MSIEKNGAQKYEDDPEVKTISLKCLNNRLSVANNDLQKAVLLTRSP